MHWSVISPWMTNEDKDQWFLQYIDQQKHTFSIIPYHFEYNWHNRKSKVTSFLEWKKIWSHVSEAEKTIGQDGGLITLFPQRAAMAGLRKMLFRKKYPVVAWYFNIGRTYPGWKSVLSRSVFQYVDKLVVPSTWEMRQYKEWLQLPDEKFSFAYYQCPLFPIAAEEEEENPFILALGSANRDFKTFFQAVKELGIRTVVVSSDKALEGLSIPQNVEVNNQLTRDDCRLLAQKARINVVPIGDTDTASGHVTIVEAMAMRRPLIVTECPGLSDYVEDRKTVLACRSRNVKDMKEKIQEMWDDTVLRKKLSANAYQFAKDHCSDQAAARQLCSILDEVSVRK